MEFYSQSNRKSELKIFSILCFAQQVVIEPKEVLNSYNNLSACLNDLIAMCTAAKLPLVIWGANKAYTISVKYLPKFFDFMRFLGSSNRR